MQKAAFYLLLAMVVAGTLVLASGTRSLTDIKGAVLYGAAPALAALAAWGYALGGRVPASRGLRWFAAAAGGYLAFTAASALWARHPWVVWLVLADRAIMLALAATVALIFVDSARWRQLAAAYTVLGAFTAAASLVYHWRSHTFNDVRFPMGNANLLAAFLLLTISLATAFLWREISGQRRRVRIAALAGALALMLAVFLLCRPVSYIIGLGVFAVVFAALRNRRRAAVIVVIAAVLAAAGFGFAWKEGLVERFQHTKSYIVRAELWRRAWRMTEDKPLAGWGAGNYFTDSQPYIAETALKEVMYFEGGAQKREPLSEALPSADSNAHNEYLHQTAEGGLAGLALYVAVIAAVIAAGMRARKAFAEPVLLDGALAAFAAFLVTNSMNPEVRFPEFGAHFWILAGMVVAAGGAAEAAWRRVPREWSGIIAGVVTVAAAFGIWEFSIRDYRASQAFWRGERLQGAALEVSHGIRTASTPQEVEAARRQVRTLYAVAGGEYQQAADNTRHQVLRIRALYSQGASFAAAGQVDGAIKAFEELAAVIDSLHDTHYQLGRLYEAAGRPGEALRHYERYLATHPEECLLDQGRQARAHIGALAQALESTPAVPAPSSGR